MSRFSSVCHLLMCYLFAGLLVAVNCKLEVPEPPKCNNLTADFHLRDDADACQFDKNDPRLGSRHRLVLLDFSEAQENVLNTFFAKGFETIDGSVKMEGNKYVVTINFAGMKEWSVKHRAYFRIKNNPKLKNITWNNGVGFEVIDLEIMRPKVFVEIYNNPLLNTSAVTQFESFQREDISVYLSKELYECKFEDVRDRRGHYPSVHPEVLKNCGKIYGDLKLKKMTITRNLELDNDACLRLIDMEMKGAVITAPPGKGNTECKDSSKAKSETRNNKNLCHTELQKIYEYFEDASEVIIEPDISCATTCKTQFDIDHLFIICDEITEDLDISSWFAGSRALPYKHANLKRIQATVTISSSNIKTINLTALMEVKQLKIIDNPDLREIILPSAVTIEELTITGNDKLKLPALKFPKIKPKNSTIACNVDNSTTISDIRNLEMCTVIKGKLVLKGLRQQPEDHVLKDKIIDGCVTVEGTKIHNVKFLDRAVIQNCTRFHMFKDNPELCPIKALHNQTVEIEGKRKIKGCEKVCKSLKEKECVIFDGSLTITDATSTDELRDLQIIKGDVTIIGTKLKNLTFPKLETIKSDKAPALKIKDNGRLEWISMPNILTIITADGSRPYVEIVNNYQLEDQEFLPEKVKNSCQDMETAICYLPYNKRGGDGIPLYGWFIIAALLLHLSAIGFVVAWKCFKPDFEISQKPPKESEVEAERPELSVTPSLVSRTPATVTPTSGETTSVTKDSNLRTPQQLGTSKSPEGKTPKMSNESEEKETKKF